MIITNAKYYKDTKDAENDDNIGIEDTIDGQMLNITLDEGNRHYAEILKQVADGDITIVEAD